MNAQLLKTPGFSRMANLYTDYDFFAAVYNTHWGDFADRQALPAIERYMAAQLPEHARILDLCCGTGQLARALTARGYAVIGIDGSYEMLRFARKNAPEAAFRQADAREFSVEQPCNAVVSTFDSLNHIMSLAELTAVFRNVYAALLPGGVFLFDLNLEAGYIQRWRGSFAIVEELYICAVRSSYRADERVGYTDITVLQKTGENSYARGDLRLTQRCYTTSEISDALEQAGFIEVNIYDAADSAPVSDQTGRGIFVCRKLA